MQAIENKRPQSISQSMPLSLASRLVLRPALLGWIIAVLTLLAGCEPALAADPVSAPPQAGTHRLFLPGITGVRRTTQPPQLPSSNLPEEVVGTWFSGDKLPYDFYDPTTGKWADPTGLGQMVTFALNGDYTYTAIARTQYGQCSGSVSVYRQGKARSQGATLILTPDYAKTRTVTTCGATDESVTDGPYTPQQLGYRVEPDQFGHIQLTLTDDSVATTYFKDGMAPALVGAWHHGAVSSQNFYDPATQTFAPATGEGMWFRFNADGTYSAGEVGYITTQDGCTLTGWVIQHGTVSVSGGALTVTPVSGVARVENACTPGESQQGAWVDIARTYTWLFRDQATTPKLVLIPLERFQEIEFTGE